MSKDTAAQPSYSYGEALPDPDRRIDAAVHARFRAFVLDLDSGPVSSGLPVPQYSTSLDAVIDLVNDHLPGWIWRTCSRTRTFDVCLKPDASHPEHGEGFVARWPQTDRWLMDGPGLDAHFPPAKRGAMPLLALLIEVIDAMNEGREPDPTAPAARAFFAQAIAARDKPFRQTH